MDRQFLNISYPYIKLKLIHNELYTVLLPVWCIPPQDADRSLNVQVKIHIYSAGKLDKISLPIERSVVALGAVLTMEQATVVYGRLFLRRIHKERKTVCIWRS